MFLGSSIFGLLCLTLALSFGGIQNVVGIENVKASAGSSEVPPIIETAEEAVRLEKQSGVEQVPHEPTSAFADSVRRRRGASGVVLTSKDAEASSSYLPQESKGDLGVVPRSRRFRQLGSAENWHRLPNALIKYFGTFGPEDWVSTWVMFMSINMGFAMHSILDRCQMQDVAFHSKPWQLLTTLTSAIFSILFLLKIPRLNERLNA